MRAANETDWNAPISVSELNLLARQLIEQNIALQPGDTVLVR
jgi:hypothetical protein